MQHYLLERSIPQAATQQNTMPQGEMFDGNRGVPAAGRSPLHHCINCRSLLVFADPRRHSTLPCSCARSKRASDYAGLVSPGELICERRQHWRWRSLWATASCIRTERPKSCCEALRQNRKHPGHKSSRSSLPGAGIRTGPAVDQSNRPSA